MSLSPESARSSIKRILAVFPATEQQALEYLDVVIEACGFMTAIQFEEVCKEVVKTATAGRRPVPAQYIAVYHRLRHEAGNAPPKYQAPAPETPEQKRFREDNLMAEIVTFTPKKARSILPYAKHLRGVAFPEEAIQLLEQLALSEASK